MKCSYHPAADAQDFCSSCNRALCSECAHRIKGKTYCGDCLVRGAEWAATVKDLRLPKDSPKRAALCALIPGMGAVYNNEYVKAMTYFAVFAALVVMGDEVHAVFGFAAFAFLIFTVFEAYRTAETRARAQMRGIEAEGPALLPADRTHLAWGILLMVLGTLFLLQNIIPYRFLHRLWPLIFILAGAYLIYRALESRITPSGPRGPAFNDPLRGLTEKKEL